MPTTFEYHVSPDRVPYSLGSDLSVVTLMVTVTNTTAKDVDASMIQFTVSTGLTERDVTDRGGITANVASGTSWSVSPSGTKIFRAMPTGGAKGIPSGGSIGFLLANVTVNATPGRGVIEVVELTDDFREGELIVTKEKLSLAITSFFAAPVEVVPNQPSLLTWTTAGASSVSLKTERGSETVDRNGSAPVSPLETTIYTLTAEGGGTVVAAHVAVSVATVRVVSFEGQPRELAQDTDVTFTWVVVGASSCWIEPLHQEVAPNGSPRSFQIHDSGPYTIEARGYGRADSRSVHLTVMKVVLEELTAVPLVIDRGGTATLQWRTKWATGCLLDPPGQPLDAGGTLPVSPTTTTTYELTAIGLDPKRGQVTVAVGAVIAWLELTPDPGDPGRAVLTWETHAGEASLAVWTQGTPAPEPVPSTGTQPFTVAPLPAATYVRLSVVGGGVTATANLTIGGPLAQDGAELRSLQFRCGSGLNSPRAVIDVSWQTAGGTVRGEVRDAYGRWPITGDTGRMDLRLGQRVGPRPALWDGDIYVAGPSNGPGVAWTVT